MKDAMITCAHCSRFKGEHRLANFADGPIVGAPVLICPTAVFRDIATHDTHEQTDRALFDALAGASDSRREPQSEQVPASDAQGTGERYTHDQPRIADRCPSCGKQTLFIGAGGWLTCSWLKCKEPGVGRAIDVLKESPTTVVSIAHTQHAARVAAVTLSPWLRHHEACARLRVIDACDCGLDEALAMYKQPKACRAFLAIGRDRYVCTLPAGHRDAHREGANGNLSWANNQPQTADAVREDIQ